MRYGGNKNNTAFHKVQCDYEYYKRFMIRSWPTILARRKQSPQSKRNFGGLRSLRMLRSVASCEVCQWGKVLNQRLVGLLQTLEHPVGRWTGLTIDSIILPKAKHGYNAALVVVDRSTKKVIYIPTKSTTTACDTARLFLQYVFRKHEMPLSIVSDRDSRFMFQFFPPQRLCVMAYLFLLVIKILFFSHKPKYKYHHTLSFQ
jgi:hypothetical protein